MAPLITSKNLLLVVSPGYKRRLSVFEPESVLMGEAKRRREQFRSAPKQCVFCGGIATTRDHVPPKNLFLSPRPRLITVPACINCNGSLSALEDEFRVFWSRQMIASDGVWTVEEHASARVSAWGPIGAAPRG